MRTLIATATAAVALALATPVYARPWAAFYCGELQIALIPEKYFDPGRGCTGRLCDGKEHFFDMKKDPQNKRPLSDRLFRDDGNGTLFYKGKKCRDFTEEDYDALN